MWNEELPMQVRLKASELLAKSEGDFLERMDLSNTDGSMRPVVAPPSPLAVMEELMRRCDEEEGDTNRLPSGIKVAM